jgi:hypothetical protein
MDYGSGATGIGRAGASRWGHDHYRHDNYATSDQAMENFFDVYSSCDSAEGPNAV